MWKRIKAALRVLFGKEECDNKASKEHCDDGIASILVAELENLDYYERMF